MSLNDDWDPEEVPEDAQPPKGEAPDENEINVDVPQNPEVIE